MQIFPLFFSWFVSLLPIKWQKQDIRLIFKPTLKTVKMCIKKCSIFCQEWVISKHSMLSYLWLVSSTIMVEIRVELLITLILQFKLPWPSSTYWGWLSIKHRSNWKNNETRDQTKKIKPKQPYILKDLSVISFFDYYMQYINMHMYFYRTYTYLKLATAWMASSMSAFRLVYNYRQTSKYRCSVPFTHQNVNR